MDDPVCERAVRAVGGGLRAGWCWRVFGFGWVAALSLGVSTLAEGELEAWRVAARYFQGAAYDLAERELQGFVQRHPDSAKAAEAHLLLAECRFHQRNHEGALEVLRAGLERAGVLVDQYRYWVAENLLQLGRWDEAIAEYQVVLRDWPESARRLDAVVGQASALQRAGRAGEAFGLLADPEGVFLRQVAAGAGGEVVARGYLLLGEAALAGGQAGAGEALLSAWQPESMPSALGWQRDYLVTRLQAGSGRWEAAAETVLGLVDRLSGVTNGVGAVQRADALALAGEVLLKQGDASRALGLFEQNLGVAVPTARRHEAGEQIATIILARGEEGGFARLGLLAGRSPGDPALDPVRVAWAELGLRRYYGLAPAQRPAGLGELAQIRQQLGAVVTNAAGIWTGRAKYALGWCLWEERGDVKTMAPRWALGAAAFEGAAEQLPRSIEQAVARFKAGDFRFGVGDYPVALGHYWAVATNYTEWPELRKGFADQALYQVVRGSVVSGDMEAAERAMGMILAWYPESYFGDRSVLVFGQALGGQGHPAEARRLFTEYLSKFPTSGQSAELGLAVARTYQQEGKWDEAVTEFQRWLDDHPEHASRGQAGYELAWSTYRAGDAGRAFERFTGFLSTFPLHSRAPDALHWVADYHFVQGRFDQAEREYQRIYQNTNWPASELTFHARVMAGRSAFRRMSYRDARAYFTELINTNCPPGLLPEAYFLLGDTIRAGADATNLLASLGEAIVAYSKIPQNHPESRFVPLAWGEIGNCHYQLGSADSKQYDLALAAYTNVMASVRADVTARSQAAVGVAQTLERKAMLPSGGDRNALLTEALAQYLAVTEGKNLREGELADLFWVERAGSAGAALAEQLQRWEVAEGLYRRLIELAPPLREKYALRLQRLQQLRAENVSSDPVSG
jgi:TolA-binding protein